MMPKIIFKQDTANPSDILFHITACKKLMQSLLSRKIAPDHFSEKISQHANTFEAWDHRLIGLVSCYFNNHKEKIGFINNVSVINSYRHRGIAESCLNQCILFGKENNFDSITLEVHNKNTPAINLYRKIGFKIKHYDVEYTQMVLNCKNTNQN